MAIDTSAKTGSMLDKPTDILAKKLAGTHKLWSVADKEELVRKDIEQVRPPAIDTTVANQVAADNNIEDLAGVMASTEDVVANKTPEELATEEAARIKPRVQQFGEIFNKDIKTLRGAYELEKAITDQEGIDESASSFGGAINRAGKVAGLANSGLIAGTKLTADQKAKFLSTGNFREAAQTSDAPVAPLYKNINNLNTTNKNIFYDVLDAGTLNDKGTFIVDPELFGLMGVLTEEHFVQSMFTTDPDEVSETVGETTEQDAVKQMEFKKSQGLQNLGKEIYREYKRTRASQKGLADTAEYLNEIDNISPEVFTQIGDLAKTSYAAANSDMIQEKNIEGRVVFQPTEKGAKIFENMYRVYTGLFNTTEVAPLASPSQDGRVMGEASQYTRDMTTRLSKEIGDTSAHFEATKNMNEVAFVNDPNREKVATYLAMLALANAGTVKTTQNMQDEYMPGRNGDIYYANIFKIGKQKYQDLLNEKASLQNKVQRLIAQGASEDQVKLAEKTYREYNPKNILRLEREKFVNLMEGVGRYSGKSNYLTFALQLLTGRMHAQQTIYNPQASPIIRGIVGGGNKYQWQPGKGGKLEQNWTEGMSKHLFEDPKVTNEEGRKVESSFKKEFGMGRPTEERIRVFKEFEKQAEQNPGAGLYNQYVQWGNELIDKTAGFNTREANAILNAFKKATGQQGNEIKKQIGQRYGTDPLSPRLKAYLADFEIDAIHQADYLMALAKYERAKKNGTIFTDTQAFEIDGQTHGPSTLATLLGSLNMAKRSGIIMKTPFLEKLESSDYKDVRDAMADEMIRKFPTLIKGVTKITHDSKEGLPSIANAYESILLEAIKDRENFLKKSPMTMGYGQDIFSLKQHVDRTVFLNDKIKTIMANNKLSNNDVIDFLHTILVDSIYETMDPQTLRMTKLMKAVAFMSPLSGQLLQIKQPTGLISTLAGLTSEQAGQTQYQIKDAETGKPRTVTVQHYKVKTDPSAMKPMPGKAPEFGGYAVGRAQPSIIQAFDSNMVTKTFTKSWNKIKEVAKSLGAANPFVLQIYDAFLTDSGTMDVVRRSANEHHKDSIINEQGIEKLFDWYENSFTERLNTLSNDTTTYELFKDGVVNKESEFKTIAGLLASPDRFKNQARKTFVKLIQRQGDFQWERGDNTNITGDTLEQWNKKTFEAAKKMALDLENRINTQLKVSINIPQMTRLDANKLSAITGESEADLLAENKRLLAANKKSGGRKSLLDKNFTGQEIAIIIKEILATLDMNKRIKEGRQIVTQSRGELAKEIGSQATLNIDL